MGAAAPAHGAAQAAQTARSLPRSGPSTLAQCLLRGPRANLLGLGPRASEPCSTQSSLTGEPDAGNLPVRFGGRGKVLSLVPTPIGGGRGCAWVAGGFRAFRGGSRLIKANQGWR